MGRHGALSEPTSGCISALQAKLDFNETKAGFEKMKLQWKGLESATTQAGFGDPVAGDTSVAICIYDDSAALVQQLVVDRAGQLCTGSPCWSAKGAGGYGSLPAGCRVSQRVGLGGCDQPGVDS